MRKLVRPATWPTSADHDHRELRLAGVELVGLRAGPPRRPQLPLSKEERGNLAALLKDLGVKAAALPARRVRG